MFGSRQRQPNQPGPNIDTENEVTDASPFEAASPAEAFFTTWKESTFHPTSFFRQMPREGRIAPAIVYYLILGVVVAGVNLFWSSMFEFASLASLLGAERAGGSMRGVVEFLLSPLILMATLYLISGISHLILSVIDGANNGFNTTLRVFAYSYSPALFAVVPLLGGIVALIWMTVLSIIGLREAHETSGGKTATAVLAPFGCLMVILAITVMLAVAAGVLGTKL